MNIEHTIANDVLLGQVCELLAEGRRVKLRAKGDSMRPFIHGQEDTLLLAPAVKVCRGDVVLARTTEDLYVVHRVLRMEDDSVELGGDGNLFRRETCTRTHIYGIVEAIVRDGRTRGMTSMSARLLALGWRVCLPFRRVWWIVRQALHSVRRLSEAGY